MAKVNRKSKKTLGGQNHSKQLNETLTKPLLTLRTRTVQCMLPFRSPLFSLLNPAMEEGNHICLG